MGREAIAICTWQGQTAEVTALLESQEIILRGGIKAKFPRATIGEPKVDHDKLVLTVGSDRLILELGHVEAGKWQALLLKPPPMLAVKLGIGPSTLAYVLGSSDDPELALALADATTPNLAAAAMIVAIINDESDLRSACEAAQKSPPLPIWFVYGKAKYASVTDTEIRTFMRGNGYVDTKSCSVSEKLTATRYSQRRT